MQVQSPDFFIAPFSGFRVLGQYQVVHTDFTDCFLSFCSRDQGLPGKASALGFCHFCGGGAAEPPESRTTPVNAMVTPTPTATFFQSMFLTNSTTSSLTRFAVVQKFFTVFSTEAVQEFRMLSASFSLDLPQLCRVSPVFWAQVFALLYALLTVVFALVYVLLIVVFALV